MIRVGIIGLGGMGRGRLGYYAQIPEAWVVAIADIRAAELQCDPGLLTALEIAPQELRWFHDAHALVSSGAVDMVDICLPTGHHHRATVAALEAGLDVLCEKPMALNSQEADDMVAASQRTGQLLMVAQCIRFWPEYTALTDLLASGEAGPLLSLQMARQGSAPTRGWFSHAAESGGALLDLHVHDIDFCQHLLGLPQRIYAQGGMSQGPEQGYDYVLTNLDYGSALQVSAVAQWATAPIPFSARYEARLAEAYLRFDSAAQPTLTVYRPGRAPESPTGLEGSAYLQEIRYFVSCVQRREQPIHCLPASSRHSVALIEATRASLQRHELVRVDEFIAGAPAPAVWDSAGCERVL